jgi:predicted ATPase
MRHTNWQVITGAPCSGKTAVILGLEQMGYRVVHEAARAFIDEQVQNGRSIPEIKSDVSSFENVILSQKIKIERSLPDNEIIFLDRAIPDSIAYFIVEGITPRDPIHKSKSIRYKNIFLFARLKFEKDDVRSEDDVIADRLDRLLQKSYELLDYDVIRVPVMSIQDRIEFILERI